MTKIRAVLALGSNLGDRGEHIIGAAQQLGAIPGIALSKLSPIVESFAVTPSGIDETKPKYLNAVALIETTLKPKELLAACQSVESEHGRVRVEKWGSRTLDIDIITYGDEVKSNKTLMIPHPRAYQRAFVLVPWALSDPDAILPGHGLVAQLAAEVAGQVWVIDTDSGQSSEPSK